MYPLLRALLALLDAHRLHVGVEAAGDAAARGALAAWRLGAFAVEGLRQLQGQRVLAHTLRAGEQVGVGDAALAEGALKRGDGALLAGQGPSPHQAPRLG